MNVAIVVYSNDPETVWNAFRFANALLAADTAVSVFLLGKGVEAGGVNTLKFDVTEQLNLFRECGGNLIGCGVCCEARKDEFPFLGEHPGYGKGTMLDLQSLVVQADKVITF